MKRECDQLRRADGGCREKDPAQKLSDWYGIRQTKTPQQKTEMQSSNQNPSTSGDSVKYMASIDAWYDEQVKRGGEESDEDYRKRVLKAIKQKLIESFRSGKAQR